MPCYADPYPTFQPAMRLITAITRSNPAQITTSFNHQFISGMIVRIDISDSSFGMAQINGLMGTITVTGLTTFTIDLDTTSMDPFVIPAPLPTHYTCPQVIPVGDLDDETTLLTTHNVLPY